MSEISSGEEYSVADIDNLIRAADEAGNGEDVLKLYEFRKSLLSNDVQENSQPVDFDVGTMVSNIPGSAINIGKDMATAVMRPVETTKAVGSIVNAGVEKLGRTLAELTTGETIAPKEGAEEPINAVGVYVKDRYGSIDSFQRTLMEDPAGVLLDFASFAPTKIPVLAKYSKVAEPFSLFKNVTKPAASKLIPETAVNKLYQSAAKFSNTLDPKQRAQMIRTALDEGIMPTAKGVNMVEDRVGILNNMLDDLITDSVAANKQIPVDVVYRYINDLMKVKGGVKIEAMSDVKNIQKIIGEFHINMKGRTSVSPKELQEFKKDAYVKIGWDAKRMKGTPVKEDTFKAMARGAKEGIQEAIPEAAEINRALGDLYDLQPHLIRAAQRIENNNIVSLGGGMKMGGGGIIGATSGSPVIGFGTGVLAHIISTPKMKARLAVALNKMKKGDTDWLNQNSHWPEVRVALALAGRAEQSNQEQN